VTAQAKTDEDQLIEDIESFEHDPLGFVYYAFPWGEPGTALEEYEGPDEWSVKLMMAVATGLLDISTAIQIAVASGHGIGKSATVAWLILWAICTKVDTKGVVTANTFAQLQQKTWAEVGKWYELLICKHWFIKTATALYSSDPAHKDTWRIDASPWSENNTEAFQGLHNLGKRIIVVIDEASAVADLIWDVIQGALTDANTEIIWCVFGNPTRNTGKFRECFGKNKHRWIRFQVDSRTVKITNKVKIKEWEDDYGDDSDFFRVRVKGEFPRASSMQLIGTDLVEKCKAYVPHLMRTDPLIFGVDVARFGDDQSVIWFRKGRDAKSIPPKRFRKVDTMQLSGVIAQLAEQMRPDAIFVDATGIGGAVVDRLRQLKVPHVFQIEFSASSDRYTNDGETPKLANKRAEIWYSLMRAMKEGIAIPNDTELTDELTAVEYGYNGRDEIQLEKKDKMKDRGLSSPDNADALALTYSYTVMPSHSAGHQFAGPMSQAVGNNHGDYDPFAEGRY
jgi:hypothetical protein